MAKETKQGKTKLAVIVLAIIVLILAAGLGFYVHGISATEPGNTDEVVITVEPGTATMQVLNQLDEAGLVENLFCGKVLVKLSSPEIQANTYVFNKDMTLTAIFKAMDTGDTAYISQSRVTIIEGATIPQAAAALSEASGLSEDEILAKWADQTYLKKLIKQYWFLTDEILNADLLYPLEGYLYPETYFLPDEDVDLEAVTESMLDKMDAELTPYKEDIQKKLGMTVHEFLSFASVVERESLFEEDRPMIAGVFLNRLDKGMPLQSDITVLYALGESHVDVSVAETQVDSKYNTYKYPGLPVGPVCAVPARTMDDCINYKESDYLFFFATEDGEVLYTKTYEEHLKVVEENKWY